MILPVVRPEHPANLAIFRVAVLSVILLSPEVPEAVSHAVLSPALRVVPEGLGWAAQIVPISPALARSAEAVLWVSALSGLLGLFCRTSLLLVTLSGLYLFALAQLEGSVTHDMHLLWFTALLAASPSGDALAIDAWIARRRTGRPVLPSVAYAVPLWAARALLGVIYFFPGFWKLKSAGLDWIWSDNLRNHMYWKWYQMGFLPPLRVDHFPSLCRFGALLVVAFELSFLPLILFRRGRSIALLGGLVFHLLSEVFLRIRFMSLWACYVVLIDWGAVWEAVRGSPAREGERERERERETATAPPLRRARDSAFCAALGFALLTGAVVQGARNAMQAWPFACYPTFQWTVSAEIPDLLVEAWWDDGRVAVLPDGRAEGGVRSQQRWGMAWALAGLYGRAPEEGQLRAYLELISSEPDVRAAMAGARGVRFYRASYSVVPEDRGKPPRSRRLLFEIALL
jgi:hypothetical protein